jgi:hypothetical protein
MNKYTLILLLNIASDAVCIAQNKYVLTGRDKMNYILSMNQQQVNKAITEGHNNNGYVQAVIPVKLTNNSSDTLNIKIHQYDL